MCVCESGPERSEVEYTEGEVCEGAIKALYYKSLTVRVCVEITEECLSPFCLCQNDVCVPFCLHVKYQSEGHACVISASVWSMCLPIPHLLSVLARGVVGERLGRLGKETNWPANAGTHANEQRSSVEMKESHRREKWPTTCSNSFLDWGLRIWQEWLITHTPTHTTHTYLLSPLFICWHHFLYGTLCYGIIIMPVLLKCPRNKSS